MAARGNRHRDNGVKVRKFEPLGLRSGWTRLMLSGKSARNHGDHPWIQAPLLSLLLNVFGQDRLERVRDESNQDRLGVGLHVTTNPGLPLFHFRCVL